jgi:hypothetical protein
VTDAASFAVALPLGKEKVGTMSAETDAIEAADTELAHAMGVTIHVPQPRTTEKRP